MGLSCEGIVTTNKTVDEFMASSKQWKAELIASAKLDASVRTTERFIRDELRPQTARLRTAASGIQRIEVNSSARMAR